MNSQRKSHRGKAFGWGWQASMASPQGIMEHHPISIDGVHLAGSCPSLIGFTWVLFR